MRHSLSWACGFALLLVGCAGYQDSKLYCCTDPGSCVEIVQCDRDPARPVCDLLGTQGPGHTCVAGGVGPDAQTGCDGPADCSGATPVCRTSDRVCVECLEDTSCMVAAEPVCGDDDACRACTLDAECAGRTGHTQCKEAAGTCVECTESAQCGASMPVCDTTTDSCRVCRADAECTASGVCNLETGTCVGQSDVLYVDRVAAVGNTDCTSVAPCNSITKAVTTALGSRKWILVKADATSYMDAVDLSGLRTKEVVIKGVGATVDATPDDTPAFNIGTNGLVGANVRIEGLTIIGGFDDATGDGVLCTGVGVTRPTVTLVGTTVRNNTGSGVEASNCIVTMTGSTVSGNTGGGISLTASSFHIANNFFIANGNGTSSSRGVTFQTIASGLTPTTFVFNTMFENLTSSGPRSVFCSSVDKVLTLRNNLIWGVANDRDEVTVGDANCVHTYSVVGPKPYTEGTNNVDIVVAGATRENLFLSATDPVNLHLKAGSAAINKADTGATEPLDIDGEARPKGTARDIGADEAE